MNESKFTVTSKGVQLAAVILALLVAMLALPGLAWAAKRPPQPPLAVTKYRARSPAGPQRSRPRPTSWPTLTPI